MTRAGMGRLGVAVVTLAFALATATALADAEKLQGAFKGDGNSTVSFRVKIGKDGTPKRVHSVLYSNVDLACSDGSTVEVSGRAAGGEVKAQHGKLHFLAGGPGDPAVNINGNINHSGTRANGNAFIFTDNGACSMGGGPGPALRFRADAR